MNSGQTDTSITSEKSVSILVKDQYDGHWKEWYTFTDLDYVNKRLAELRRIYPKEQWRIVPVS